jgi:hypothetical protein
MPEITFTRFATWLATMLVNWSLVLLRSVIVNQVVSTI